MHRPNLCATLIFTAMLIGSTGTGSAQTAPQIGYVFPAGGQAGTTVDVRLGGYNLTPDMQFFVHDRRVQLNVLGPPGDILITPPPYWKGNKANLADPPLAREIPAQIIIPAEMPAGMIEWQLANANGVSNRGRFFIGRDTEVVEDEVRGGEPQSLPGLPVTVSGRLSRIEEVDCYRIQPDTSGLVNCELLTHRLGTPVHGVLELRDAGGNLLTDTVDTEGVDPVLTFAAEQGQEYFVSVHDLDFSGNGSYVYRLRISQGPRVLATVPAVTQRGQTVPMRFFGLGVATGELKTESVLRNVSIPDDPTLSEFTVQLETEFGIAAPFRLPVRDVPILVDVPEPSDSIIPLTPPVGLTYQLDRSAEQRFRFTGQQGEVWDLQADARVIGSPLDVMLAVLDEDGTQLAANDDANGSTDAALQFTVPVDGMYTIVVSDQISGMSGSELAHFHLSVAPPPQMNDGFEINVPQSLNAGLGAVTELKVNAVRRGEFREAIAVELSGLPAGLTVPDDLVISAEATELKISISSAEDSAVVATMVEVHGTAQTSATRLTRALLLATTMKPRCKIRPVDKDGGRTVHRGTTHAGEVILTRLEGFEGEVRLMMAANQSRHRQGISGPQVVVVPPGETRAFFPCYMPEWLGTDLTQRMSLIAVARVPDPQGNLRHLVSPMEGNIVMSIEGALLKLTQEPPRAAVPRGTSFELPVQILRAKTLSAPVRLELELRPEYAGTIAASPIVVPADQEWSRLHIDVLSTANHTGEIEFSVKGTAMDEDSLPVVARDVGSIVVRTP